MDDITDGWWDWNVATNEEYLSPKFKAMFGYKDHEMANSPESWQAIIYPEDKELILANAMKHIESCGDIPYNQEVRYKHRNGSTVWVICRGKVIRDKKGQFTRIIGTHTDITSTKLSENRLNELAMQDPLTGLANRNSCISYLTKAITRAKRYKRRMALFYIDIDNFKQINDSMGHNVGDKFLNLVVSRLKVNARTIDFISRTWW